MKQMRAILGQETKTDVGVITCPSCDTRHVRSIMAGRDDSFKCYNCNTVLAETPEELPWIQEEIGAYICPECGKEVVDCHDNWLLGPSNLEGKPSVVCPRCHIVLNGMPTIHHGHGGGELRIFPTTDYFAVQHKECRDREHHGYCDLYAALIDNVGRIILNYQCLDCKIVDAIKTSIHSGTQREGEHRLSMIFLSPKLLGRVGKHDWDDM